MPKLPKCKYCGEQIESKENAIKKSNGYFHQYCYKLLQEEKETKKSDKNKLIDYIKELYDGDVPVYVYIQIEEFKKKYNMKYTGMLLCLKYCFEDLGLQFDNDNGIGILLYYYDKCKKEWIHKQEIKKAIDEFEFEDKEVVINKRFNSEEFKKIKYKPIKMEEL